MEFQCRLYPRYRAAPWLRAKRKRWRTLHELAALAMLCLLTGLVTAGWQLLNV